MKNVNKAVQDYNITLETEILIEAIAEIQADYFRFMQKNDIVLDKDSADEVSQNAFYLYKLKNDLLEADSLDKVFFIKEKIKELKKIIQ